MPFAIVQVYVAAPVATGTEAFAVAFAQTLAGAVIVVLGSGLTVTTTGDDVAVQPLPFPTVTV